MNKKWIPYSIIACLLYLFPIGVYSQDNPDSRIQKLEQENSQLREMLLEMKDRLDRLEKKGDTLKSEDKSPKEEKKKSGKKKEDTPKANASVAAAADLPSETEETKEKTIDTTKQDLEDIRVTDKKKKAENWLPSYFGEKFRLGGRVKIDYFDGGDESQLPSAIPEHPGGSFSLDEVRLYLDGELSKDIFVRGIYELSDKDSNVLESYAQFINLPLNSGITVGLQKQFFRPSRYTQTYPLIGRAFWKSRQLGITWKTENDPLLTYLSLNNGAGLNNNSIGQDGAAPIVGDKENNLDLNGNKEVSGGLGLEHDLGKFGEIKLLGFAGTGNITDDDIAFLQKIPGYGYSQDATHQFVGGQAGYTIANWDFFSQYIAGKDGNLDRSGWYAEISKLFTFGDFKYLQSIRPLVRYGQYNVDIAPSPYSKRGSFTWDREQWLLALITQIRSNLNFRAEYSFNDEETGGPNADNNEILLQLEILF